jgi:hypothetical protein
MNSVPGPGSRNRTDGPRIATRRAEGDPTRVGNRAASNEQRSVLSSDPSRPVWTRPRRDDRSSKRWD